MNYLLFKSMFNEEFKKYKLHNSGQSVVKTLQNAYTSLLRRFKSCSKIPAWLEASFKNFVKINNNGGLLGSNKEAILHKLSEKLYIETYLHLGNDSASKIFNARR